MKIKKFNNGNVNLKLENDDKVYYHMEEYLLTSLSYKRNINTVDIDKVYNDEINMNDLYFNQINGYMYLVDYNTQNIYDFSDCHINILVHLKNLLVESFNTNKTLKLYPVSRKEYNSLMIDLENGY